MAEEMDFKIDWDLPDYPQLPKMFTSAKAAKKRKHREFIMTDEVLDRVVKIPTAAKNGAPAAQQQSAASPAAAGSNAAHPTATPGDTDAAAAAPSKAERKRQKREAKLRAPQQPADADAAAPASADATHKKHKQPPAAAAAEAAGGLEADSAQPESTKKKKNKKVEPQQDKQHSVHLTEPDAAPAAAQPQQEGTTAEALPKKSRKNKFKTQEFLQQQGQQQQQTQVKHQKQQQQQQGEARPQKKQLETVPQQQQQQGGTVSPDQPSSLSKGQLKKLKKAQQQQQQADGAAGKPVPAAKASPAAAGDAGAKVVASLLKGAAAAAAAGAAGGSKLLQQFKERLQGSRFRQLNETLYTQPGDASFSTMQEQPELFAQYHEGFQQQVKAWPSQPLDAAITWLKPQPADWVVADFGCGEARLAASVKQTVHSLDLVAAAPGVIACNMARTPLDTGSCDVAVFSLALMGTDYGAFLVEASRVLKPGGWLWVAEVRSRFADTSSGKEDFRPLLAALKALGFKLVQQDAANRMFVVWVLQKKADGAKPGAAASIKWPALRACMYKKR